MRLFNIKLFALIAFLSISNGVFAYTWGYSNHTKKVIDIRFGLMGARGWWDGTVRPGKRFTFSWEAGNWYAGYCLWGAEWKESGQGDDKYKSIDVVYMPDKLYDETLKQASNIGSGFDTFLCNAVILTKILNKGVCPSVFAAIINWFGGIIARSACRSREFSVYQDDKGELMFTTLLN